jgi:hypothetical protein
MTVISLGDSLVYLPPPLVSFLLILILGVEMGSERRLCSFKAPPSLSLQSVPGELGQD